MMPEYACRQCRRPPPWSVPNQTSQLPAKSAGRQRSSLPTSPRVVRNQPISAVQSNAGNMKVTLEQAVVLFRQQSLCRKNVLLKLPVKQTGIRSASPCLSFLSGPSGLTPALLMYNYCTTFVPLFIKLYFCWLNPWAAVEIKPQNDARSDSACRRMALRVSASILCRLRHCNAVRGWCAKRCW